MAQPTIDPTFYRTAAEAAAAPGEQLAYVVAFDRAAQKSDAMTVIDVNPASDTFGRVVGWTTSPPSVTSCTTSVGTLAAPRSSTRATTSKASRAATSWCRACAHRTSTCSTPRRTPANRRWSRRSTVRHFPQRPATPVRTPCTADPTGSSSPAWAAPKATTTDRAGSRCSTTRPSRSCAPGRQTAGRSTSTMTPGGTSIRTC